MTLRRKSERPSEVIEPVLSKEQQKMLADLGDRLRTLCRNISGDLNLKVEPGISGKGWFWDSKKNIVKFDPKDVLEKGEKFENVLKGIIAHEAGHRVITRWPEFVPEEVLHELGFHSLMTAVEERPTDQVVRDRYAGAGQWVDEARKDTAARESSEESAKEKIGKIPKFMQFCDLVVYHPHHTPELMKKYDSDVLEFYEKMREAIENIEHTLPEEGSKESEVLKLSKNRYRKTYKELWPKVKEFAKQDLEEETLRQMMQELRDVLEESVLNENGELSDILDKAKKEKETQEKEIDNEAQKTEQEATQQSVEHEVAAQFSTANLSDEDKKTLRKAFDALTADERKELQEKARQTLEELEDVVVESMQAKLAENAETHSEHEERLEKERRAEEREERRQEEEEQLKEEEEIMEEKRRAIEQSTSVYEKTYQEVREFDEILFRHLEEIFTPSLKKKVRLKSTGSRLNLPAVYRWEAGRGAGSRSLDTRIFEFAHIPEKKDYAVTLLVDLSGSMSSNKIEETFKGVVLLTEVLNRLGVKCEILGFQDENIIFKEFDERLSDAVRGRMSGMIAETEGRNPGGHNNPGYNDDGPCLKNASKRLGAQSAKEKILIVFSDGQPAGSHSTEQDLVKAVHDIVTRTDQKLVAVGLGYGTDHVKHYYPASLPNIDVEQLPEVLSALLEDLIASPQKYR